MTTQEEFLRNCRMMKEKNIIQYHEDYQTAKEALKDGDLQKAEEFADRAQGWLNWSKFWEEEEEDGWFDK